MNLGGIMNIVDLESKIYYESKLCYIIGDYFRKFVSVSKPQEKSTFTSMSTDFKNAYDHLVSVCYKENILAENKNLLSAYQTFFMTYLLEETDYIKSNGKLALDKNRKILAISNSMFEECYKEICLTIAKDLHKYRFHFKNVTNQKIHECGIYAISVLKSYVVSKNIKHIASALKDQILTEYPTVVTEFLHNLKGWGNITVSSYSPLDAVISSTFSKDQAKYINDCICNLGVDESVNDIHRTHASTRILENYFNTTASLFGDEPLHYELYIYNEKVGLRIQEQVRSRTNKQVNEFNDNAKYCIEQYKEGMTILKNHVYDLLTKVQLYPWSIENTSLEQLAKDEIKYRNEVRVKNNQLIEQIEEEKKKKKEKYTFDYEEPIKKEKVKKIKEKRIREKKEKETGLLEGFEFTGALTIGLIFTLICIVSLVLKACNLVEPITDFIAELPDKVSKLFNINIADWALNITEGLSKANFFTLILLALPALVFVLAMLVAEVVWFLLILILVLLTFALTFILSFAIYTLPIILSILEIILILINKSSDDHPATKFWYFVCIIISLACSGLFIFWDNLVIAVI